VLLAFQMPFAIASLVMFTRDKAKMGALVASGGLTLEAGVVADIIIALNTKLLWDLVGRIRSRVSSRQMQSQMLAAWHPFPRGASGGPTLC
jgi:hypothetical protein